MLLVTESQYGHLRIESNGARGAGFQLNLDSSLIKNIRKRPDLPADFHDIVVNLDGEVGRYSLDEFRARLGLERREV